MRQRQFYIIALCITLLGYLWIAFHFFYHGGSADVTLCLFKRLSGYPCPACGGTRSLLLLSEGQWLSAAGLNPLGYLLAIGLILLPVWLLFDLLAKRPSMFLFSEKMNTFMRSHKWFTFTFIILIIINWIWNIKKGL